MKPERGHMSRREFDKQPQDSDLFFEQSVESLLYSHSLPARKMTEFFPMFQRRGTQGHSPQKNLDSEWLPETAHRGGQFVQRRGDNGA